MMISRMVICVNRFFEISLHALSGVRVQKIQRVQRVQRGKVLRIDRPAAGGFLSLTALWAEGCGLPLCGNAYKVSVTGFTFSVIWHDKHSGD